MWLFYNLDSGKLGTSTRRYPTAGTLPILSVRIEHENPKRCANALRDIGKSLMRAYPDLGGISRILPLQTVNAAQLSHKKAAYSSHYHLQECKKLLEHQVSVESSVANSVYVGLRPRVYWCGLVVDLKLTRGRAGLLTHVADLTRSKGKLLVGGVMSAVVLVLRGCDAESGLDWSGLFEGESVGDRVVEAVAALTTVERKGEPVHRKLAKGQFVPLSPPRPQVGSLFAVGPPPDDTAGSVGWCLSLLVVSPKESSREDAPADRLEPYTREELFTWVEKTATGGDVVEVPLFPGDICVVWPDTSWQLTTPEGAQWVRWDL